MSKKTVDWGLVFLMVLLYCIGLAMVYSSSYGVSKRLTGNGVTFFYRHLMIFWVGLGGMLFFYRVSLSWLMERYMFLFFGGMILLILVFIPGISKEVSGAKRWIQLGFFSMQPSEVMKLVLLLFLAKVLAVKRERLHFFIKGSFPLVLLVSVSVLLVFVEPDISTAFLIGLVLLILLYYGGVSLVHLLFMFCMSLPFFLFLFETRRYWVSRFLFLDPSLDPYGRGYHLRQSLLSFKKGGFLGEGPGAFVGEGRPLPDAHTDFIFSIIGQELGMLGCFFIMGLYVVLIGRCFAIASRQKELEYHLLGFGVGLMIAIEVIMHVFCDVGPDADDGFIVTVDELWAYVAFGCTWE